MVVGWCRGLSIPTAEGWFTVPAEGDLTAADGEVDFLVGEFTDAAVGFGIGGELVGSGGYHVTHAALIGAWDG